MHTHLHDSLRDSQNLRFISLSFYFPVSGKVFPVTPLLSSDSVHILMGFRGEEKYVDFSGGHSRIFY